jgi:hypothetical protein
LYMYSRKRTCTFLQSQRQDGGSGYDRIGRDQRAERACSAQPKAPKKSGAPSRAAEKRGCAEAATRECRRLPSRRQKPEQVAKQARRARSRSQHNADKDDADAVRMPPRRQQSSCEATSSAAEERWPPEPAERKTRQPPPWMVVAVGVRSGYMCALASTCIIVSCRLRP